MRGHEYGTDLLPHGRAFSGSSIRAATPQSASAGIPFDLGTSNRRGAVRARRDPPGEPHCWSMAIIRRPWAEIEKMDLADVGDFRIAHGDIEGQSRQDRGAGGGISAPRRARRRSHNYTLALLRACHAARARSGWCISMGHVDTLAGELWGSSSGTARVYHAIEESLIDPAPHDSRSASVRRCTATSSTGPSARA